MTESRATAPLPGQSLRGRPVHERCTPVNEGNRPLRDEGEAVACPPPYPLVSNLQQNKVRYADIYKEAATFLLTTPSAPLRHGTFLLRRSHPSLKTEGNELASTA